MDDETVKIIELPVIFSRSESLIADSSAGFGFAAVLLVLVPGAGGPPSKTEEPPAAKVDGFAVLVWFCITMIVIWHATHAQEPCACAHHTLPRNPAGLFDAPRRTSACSRKKARLLAPNVRSAPTTLPRFARPSQFSARSTPTSCPPSLPLLPTPRLSTMSCPFLSPKTVALLNRQRCPVRRD